MKRCFRKCSTTLLLCALANLAGCAVPHAVQFPDHTRDEPVRAVIFKDTPEIKSFAERARKIGNESYPQILQILGEQPSEAPKHFDIVFQNRASVKTLMNDDSGGFTRQGKIYMGVDWLTNSPAELDSYLVHELAHVAQDYRWRSVPSYWTEGLADYAHFKLGYTNSWACAKCSAQYPHYTSGYSCAAAFLLFVEANYDDQIAVQLNQKLRRGSYKDEFFKEATGEELGKLWSAFEQTPAFTPAAAELLKLEESLGYENGQPAKGVKPDAQREIAQARGLALIAELPGGALFADAFRFLDHLRDNDELPGWRKGERGHAEVRLNEMQKVNGPNYPFRYTVTARKDSDGLIYHYAVVRESEEAALKFGKILVHGQKRSGYPEFVKTQRALKAAS